MDGMNSDVCFSLVEALPFGLYVVDSRRNIVSWNRKAARISGYFAQDVIGRPCSDTLAHCSIESSSLCSADECPMAATLHDGMPRRVVVFLRHKDGYRVRILAQTIPLKDEDGKIFAAGQIFQIESVVAGLFWEEPEQDWNSLGGPVTPEHTREQLQLHWQHDRKQFAAFLITIENIREMISSRGPSMVQTLLQSIAKTISSTLWMPHYLGTWTDHRFILLVPGCDAAGRSAVIHELQAATASCGVMWWGDCVYPKIQIQSASSEDFDSPESLLSTLDPAWRGSMPLPGEE